MTFIITVFNFFVFIPPSCSCTVESAEENCMLGPLLHAFLPATPNTPRSLAQLKYPGSRFNTPSPMTLGLTSEVTPVPSPTPFFHQLYAAVSCLEKDMSIPPPKRGRSFSADMGNSQRSAITSVFYGRKSLDVNMKLAAPSSEVETLEFVEADMAEERNGIAASPEHPDSAQHHHHHHLNSASDTESEISDGGKPDDLPPDELDDEPDQTQYMENEEEEFGSVSVGMSSKPAQNSVECC